MAVNVRRLSKPEMEQWVKAIHKVCEKEWVPALRAAYSHLMPFVDEDHGTAYTDCQYRIGLSPQLLDPEQTTLEQLAVVILHETMHNTQHHRQRLYEKKGLNGKLCNFAADLEINSIIAEGVLDINLKNPPSIRNGHWERLFGKFEKLDEQGAAKLNAQVDENGKPLFGRVFSAGDYSYQGALLPMQGQFFDFKDNLTAEQYLGLLEVEEEDLTLDQFMQRMQELAGDGDERSGGSGSAGAGEDGSLSGDGSGSGSSSEVGSGSEGDSGSGSGSGSGSSEGAGSGAGPGSGATGNSSGNGAEGESDLSGVNGSGVQGAGSGSTGSDNGTYDDGYGGEARDLGDGHVSVTHIYKRNADGTRTEVGRDSLVDDLGKHADDEVWKEVSRLGIDPITRSEEQKVRDQIAHDIELQRKSNGYGAGAGNMMLNYIERGLRPPVVDWKSMLRRMVSRSCQEQSKGRTDYTYRRINRRYSQGQFIYPGMTTYVPTVRFALDTSGSMSADEYYNALSEAEGILKFVNAKIDFVCWDGDATKPIKVRDVKEMKQSLVGGGGTSPHAVFDQIEEDKAQNRPDVLIVATDGCFDWREIADGISKPVMKDIVPIILIVYKFDEELYQNKQKEIVTRQKELRKLHKDVLVLQAWSK